MDTGPKARPGFDLSLTELYDESQHLLCVEIGTERGSEVLSDLDVVEITADQSQKADTLLEKAAQKMGRKLDTSGIRELLQKNAEHPIWQVVGQRCLACANCTMVCPTCFCSTVEDTTDLTGETAVRERRWDSCFNIDYSYIHGGSVRTSIDNRYRHWITHKLSTWIDQFGSSGCVGCGRCITWCPVGIDITEEIRKLRASQKAGAKKVAAKETA